MKKSILHIQYSRLMTLYKKLNDRLNKHFASGRFSQFTKQKQQMLLHRLEKLKQQLLVLERGAKLAGAAIALTAVFGAADLSAQTPAKVGNEFHVNTYTNSYQATPATAMDSDGDYVIVWHSAGQDYNGYGIYAQRYNAAGVPQGSEFRVNEQTGSDQRYPAVAMAGNGDFVITWSSYGQDDPGQSGDAGVYAQRYKANGDPDGNEFLVNSVITGDQRFSSVAISDLGDFVITWYSNQDGTPDIFARRFDETGTAVDAEFKVNDFTTGTQERAVVSMDNDGDFVIAWQGFNGNGEGTNYGVYARRYNANGDAQGAEFLVNTTTTNHQTSPSIALDGDGDFVIAWNSDHNGGTNVYAKRFDAAGTATSGEILVNTNTAANRFEPSVAISANGYFVVTWDSYAQDADQRGVYAQLFTPEGMKKGTEFLVNTYETESQYECSVAMDNDGDFVVAWTSYDQEGSAYGVYAQQFAMPANQTPTDLAMNTLTVDEGTAAGSVISLVSATDADDAETFTYTLVTGTGDDDNASFTIENNTIKINTVPDYNTKSTYSVRIRVTDYRGLYIEETYVITVNNITETTDASALSTLTLFPNPAKGHVMIAAENVQVRISDMAGRVVKEQTLTTNALDIADLKAGVYFVEISQGENAVTKKLVVE